MLARRPAATIAATVRVEAVGVAVADRDVGTEARERGRDRRADPLRRAGDDRDAVR